MFDTALVLVDENARPVLLIPENLPEGKTFLNIVDGGIDIGVGEKIFGQVRRMDDTSLAMLGLHEQIGMATFTGEDPDALPETIEYVAQVTDTRFKN
jgi:hypothetical protein